MLQVEDFYKTKHSGRKLQWHHHMSNGTVSFANRWARRGGDTNMTFYKDTIAEQSGQLILNRRKCCKTVKTT
jgi:hypothetical protein